MGGPLEEAVCERRSWWELVQLGGGLGLYSHGRLQVGPDREISTASWAAGA